MCDYRDTDDISVDTVFEQYNTYQNEGFQSIQNIITESPFSSAMVQIGEVSATEWQFNLSF